MTTQLIGSALDRVLQSKTFARSRSLQDFLTFIVTQSLDPDQNLKEYRIGVDVLKRGGTFDPAENSIVRVQAHRLRAKLAVYYSHEGQAEDVRIDLAPGSYTPVIREGTVAATLRCLRFPAVTVDLLPFQPLPQELPEADSVSYLYSALSSRLESLLRAGMRDRQGARAARLHLQLDFRARAGAWGWRAIASVADADTHRIALSHAMTCAPGASAAVLEKAGDEFAQAIRQRIDFLLACNS